MEDERLQLCVCFRSKFLPVCLALRQAEMGNPITLHHLCTELHRQTGVPVGHMSFVVDGEISTILYDELKTFHDMYILVLIKNYHTLWDYN